MDFVVVLLSIIQAHTISVGVGASTLAILNFFAAIADGTIEPTERRMMGIVYVVLRIAMVLILGISLFLIIVKTSGGGFAALTSYMIAQIIVLAVLYVNALLMTARMVPSTFGPAIQAGSWYTLGTLAAILPFGFTDFTFTQFFLGYATWMILAVSIVNGVMAIQKSKQQRNQNPA